MLVRSGPDQGVLQLRLHRPDRLNAMNHALAHELLAAVEGASRDEAVRVVLLSGDGRAFCAGKDRDEAPSHAFVDTLQRLARALMDSPKPVVASVHGWAVGAGLELLLNCDIVVAARSAQFKLPEVSAGLFGTGGVLALLPRKIGLARAKGVLMLGGDFGAGEAERWGLVWKVVDDEVCASHALAIATQLAMSDAKVLAELKSLLHDEAFGSIDAILKREAKAHDRLHGPW
ncbi:MAG: enoyl-CoA hydratase/isomerase family protein [Burkholderiales bacterium]|nr:enoyl-CoA hydratase/isomerase family protein [Burkholderiales bacterium]